MQHAYYARYDFQSFGRDLQPFVEGSDALASDVLPRVSNEVVVRA